MHLQISNAAAIEEIAKALKRGIAQIPDPAERRAILLKFRKAFERGSLSDLNKLLLLKRNPVNVRTFVESDDFLGLKKEIYPKILPHIEEINSGKYIEAVLTGAIGVGKTSIAIVTVAYSLYQLSCYSSPQALYGLQSHDEIIFIFQNLNASLAKDVDYARFKAMIDRSPYFKEVFPYDRNYLNELKFPNRIIVKPVSSGGTAAIGQNVFGGFIDEINFMAVIEKSKQSMDGGTYDQASVVYNALSKRRESRFMSQGELPGVVCLGSSKQYPGQFTDRKVAEAEEQKTKYGHSLIYVYDKRPWDVLPEDRFTGKWFKVFVGDENRKPRILESAEVLPEIEQPLVVEVPEEYRHSFESDIMNALRDIAGVSTLAKHPFIMDYESITACLGKHGSMLSRDDVDFTTTQISFDPKKFYRPELPRWVHLDLAVTGDSAGVAIGCVDGFTRIVRGESEVETLPKIHIDALLEVRPPRGGEIKFYKIRSLLYKLREYGLNLKWMTADTYQSKDSMQILRQKGFITGEQSLDTSTVPYDILKTALYDGRISAPRHDKCARELAQLERDTKRGKIDHPMLGSKDVADSLAGVVFGLTMRREIWSQFGIDLVHIPESIKTMVVKHSGKADKVEDTA